MGQLKVFNHNLSQDLLDSVESTSGWSWSFTLFSIMFTRSELMIVLSRWIATWMTHLNVFVLCNTNMLLKQVGIVVTPNLHRKILCRRNFDSKIIHAIEKFLQLTLSVKYGGDISTFN